MKTETPYQRYYSYSYSSEANNLVHKEGVRITRSGISIPFSAKKRVLDIACGTGLLGKTFSNNVYGFDLNKESVNLAKKNGIKATIGDVENKWNYRNSFFDIVIASHIIEHTINPDHLIQEASRVLKKNGLLIIITPNLASWFNRMLLLLGIQPIFSEVSTLDKTLGQALFKHFAKDNKPVGHLRIFTLSSLKEIVALHGFTPKNISGVEFGAFSWFVSLIDRAVAHIPSLAASIIVVAKKTK